MKKQILSVLLVLCLVFTLLPMPASAAAATSGTCGSNLKWSFSNGTLTITGTGEMYDYNFWGYQGPWRSQASSIKNIVIESGVTSIGMCAFFDFSNMTSVTIPVSVTSIGNDAFAGCNKLSTINYGGNASKWNAIIINDGNSNLTGANINYAGITWKYNNGTLTISGSGDMDDYDGYNMPWYQYKKQITKVIISQGVASIGKEAFYNYPNLTSVSLPNSIKTIGKRAFGSSENLKSITIPEGVETIGNFAFDYCKSLTNVTLPKSLKTVGFYAFADCTSLKSVTIPDSVSSLGELAFADCRGLTTVVVSNNISKISYMTFLNCDSLKSVTIPSSVKSIGESAFSRCNSLSDVYYIGTAAQWNAMAIDTENDSLKNAAIHFVHTHNYTIVNTAPTCTDMGYTTHTCSCGDSYTDNYRDALGHDYINGICSRCGEADPDYKFAPDAPELKITTSSGKPKVYWNEVDGAVKYWLYRSTDGVNFKYYDSTTSTNYTNRSTTIGTTYYYKVKAIDANDARSEFSVVKSILCKPAAPTLSINRSKGKPKLSWKAVSGAKKYWVYRSTDGVNFKYWDSTTKTTYTNKGAASGTKYYYRVKAVAVVNGNNVASANSSTKSLMTTLAKPSVSITTSGGKPKLTWNAVTGADKYYIYRSTDGKNFKYWESTTKTYYTNTGAKKNTRYYYKVKAVCASNSYANSAQSSTVSIKATK